LTRRRSPFRTPLCKGAAELGHSEATFFIAIDYHFGNFGYEVDLERAKAEYLFAADMGVIKALVNLGELLLSGDFAEDILFRTTGVGLL